MPAPVDVHRLGMATGGDEWDAALPADDSVRLMLRDQTFSRLSVIGGRVCVGCLCEDWTPCAASVAGRLPTSTPRHPRRRLRGLAGRLARRGTRKGPDRTVGASLRLDRFGC